jgi:hypothetical protein
MDEDHGTGRRILRNWLGHKGMLGFRKNKAHCENIWTQSSSVYEAETNTT